MTSKKEVRNDPADRAPGSEDSTQVRSGSGSSTDSGQALRRRAEGKVRATGVEDLEALAPEEARQLLHELRVHQLELEMQNEELRRAQEALEASRARYFDLYDLAPVGYVTLSEQGLILEANLTAATLLGVPRSALVMQRMPRFILRDDQDIYYRHRKQLFETGAPQVCELRMVKEDGTPFWVRVEATLTLDGETGVPLCRATLSDVTARKHDERELLHFEQRLQQVKKGESLARMAGAIAHHFNNKLMVVTGYLELALWGDPGPNRELTRLLSEARSAADQASEMSSMMLAYLGQTVVDSEILDLAEVCREVVEAQGAAIPRRMTLRTDISHGRPTIKANRGQLKLILTNLITNPREAIGEREGDILVSVRGVPASGIMSPRFFPADWKPQADASYACLEVSDTGVGINPDELDQIFDPFFSTKFTGRGLGLAVALGTVRTYGGAVIVSSTPGRGSTFRVFWPLEAEKAVTLRKPEGEGSQPIQGEGLVLFVDDEPQLRDMGQTMLSRIGYQVVTAGDGFEAVKIFRERKDEIRLVLLDLTMPGLNGWETLAAVRALAPAIPVILSSGYDEAQVMQGDHLELTQTFLHKPYQMKDLKAALDSVLLGKDEETRRV
jgi:two-component system, cell cycle sensor histidine kinase and response regulator CckA